MEDELSRSPQDHQDDNDPSESEESKHKYPQKRQKTANCPFTPSIASRHLETPAERMLILSYTDAEAIQKLKEIERSSLPDEVLSMKL